MGVLIRADFHVCFGHRIHSIETTSCFEHGTVATIGVESPDPERLHDIKFYMNDVSRFGRGLGTESVSATPKKISDLFDSLDSMQTNSCIEIVGIKHTDAHAQYAPNHYIKGVMHAYIHLGKRH